MPLAPPAPADPLRAHLLRLLEWRDAHAGFEAAVAGIPPERQGERPPGYPHSPWELMEHLRIAQRDILDFCVEPIYRERDWPHDYWPPTPAPPDAQAWERSVAAYVADRAALQRLVADPATDLFAPVPNGTGQTLLREVLLVADHAAYHLGQLVAVRRLLGAWG